MHVACSACFYHAMSLQFPGPASATRRRPCSRVISHLGRIASRTAHAHASRSAFGGVRYIYWQLAISSSVVIHARRRAPTAPERVERCAVLRASRAGTGRRLHGSQGISINNTSREGERTLDISLPVATGDEETKRPEGKSGRRTMISAFFSNIHDSSHSTALESGILRLYPRQRLEFMMSAACGRVERGRGR